MTAPPSPQSSLSPWRFCLAPMMQKTDRHFRYLVRLLAPRMRLYTEMITTGAILYGDRNRFLKYAAIEHPLALQLGGSVPGELAQCAGIAADWGYDEVNLNCGCPSDRVQSGAFGACLMRAPETVADCVRAMREAVTDSVTVSVKLRLGVDELYSYTYFSDFVERLVEAGCSVFHVHARKAWLSGLSPRENREIPPLEYEWVYRLKRQNPAVTVVINGGITTGDDAQRHVQHVDGVMIGRQAYDDPYGLAILQQALYPGESSGLGRHAVVARYLEYVESERSDGTYLKHMSRHLLNFFQGQPGARSWRRHLSTEAIFPSAEASVIEAALTHVADSAAPAQSSNTPGLACPP